MARRRYFRYYKRTAPKKKWASNIRQGSVTGSSTVYDLVGNSAVSASPTPVILKTGNFRIQGDCSVTSGGSSSGNNAGIFLFLVFVPEGNTVNNNLITNHPEWVMAWTAIDFPTISSAGTYTGNKFSMTSRLKRNLNSGDKVSLYVQTASSDLNPNVTFTAQFFTCAN